eukprot:TRINITY_DN1987_c0_g1_i1.p4 TRINITY_DN1987_c0_g1~~TRINITY_DN1987_c0_g1_i1.p4  ORF type:complete len:115 (+),score=9.15 TRINITY_DN1987_c0_g1_i1:398-742(+)
MVRGSGRHNEGLVRVESGRDEIVKKVDNLQNGDEPIEIVELSSVEIGRQPIVRLSEPVDDRDKQRADVAAGGDGCPEERGGGAAHALRGLIVEEFEVSDRHEGFGHAEQRVLRH